MRLSGIGSGVLVLVMGIVEVHADALVVADPDAFPAGTNISQAFPGAVLSQVGAGWDGMPGGAQIFAVNPSIQPTEPFRASTGSLAFGTDDVYPHLFMQSAPLSMRVDFASPTNYVAIDVIGNDSSDMGQLLAFNSLGTQIGSYTSGTVGTSQFETMSVTRPVWDIAYVLASGYSGESAGLDHLQYNVVPEPSTFILLSMGAIGLLAFAWRRRRLAV
jgi:hypothetical protein